MKTSYEEVKAKIVCHENGKPIVYLSVHRADAEELLLEEGKQPQGLFTIVIRKRGVAY